MAELCVEVPMVLVIPAHRANLEHGNPIFPQAKCVAGVFAWGIKFTNVMCNSCVCAVSSDKLVISAKLALIGPFQPGN